MADQHSEIATFSPCRKYRYTLWRTWSEQPIWLRGYVNFICLNPSTADETKDDNTIRKCVKFAKSWGYGAMCVTNLFAWRSTDRHVLKTLEDPIGPENDWFINHIASDAGLVIAAWSQDGGLLDRSQYVRNMVQQPLHILRMGKAEPYHPLYLPDVTQPFQWNYQEQQ